MLNIKTLINLVKNKEMRKDFISNGEKWQEENFLKSMLMNSFNVLREGFASYSITYHFN